MQVKINAKTSEKHTYLNQTEDRERDQSKPFTNIRDNRPEAIAQLKLQESANKFAQQTASSVIQTKTNSTGMPNQLKSGIEQLSGYSMDDVKVHYHSHKPAQLNAHAYAQGTDIHLASGQEKHLAHEAWHVVQQKQGRVQATKQLKGKAKINDDLTLEHEADVMGAKANSFSNNLVDVQFGALQQKKISSSVAQRILIGNEPYDTKSDEDFYGVLTELNRLDTDSLKYYKTVFSEDSKLTKNEKIYLNIINEELIKNRHQAEIYELAGQHKGVWTKAAIFMDGEYICETDEYQAGQETGHYSDLEINKNEWLESELINSEKDSEVSTLQDAYELISNNIGKANKNIKVILTGNMGPCEGCKSRIQAFLSDLVKISGKKIKISAEVDYFTKTHKLTRLEVDTRYGYPDDVEQTNSSGYKYYQKIETPYIA